MIATCFALTCFAGSLVIGVVEGFTLSVILSRSLLALLICLAVGWVLGSIAQYVADQHIQAHRRENPIPEESEVLQQAEDADDSAAQPEQGVT